MEYLVKVLRDSKDDHSALNDMLDDTIQQYTLLSNTHKKMAIILASKLGHFEEVCLLLTAKWDLSLCDKSGRTALHWAALRGHLNIVRKLIQTGADINGLGPSAGIAVTPLYEAVFGNQLSVVRYLAAEGGLLSGHTPHVPRHHHDTALSGHTPHVPRHHDTALIMAVKLNHQDVAAFLLQAGCEVNTHRRTSNTGGGGSVIALCLTRRLYTLIPLFRNAGGKITLADLEDLDNVDKEECRHYIRAQNTTMMSLMQLGRIAVRESLMEEAQGTSILENIKELPLPRTLQEYLSLKPFL